jgi:hypothetical protein
MPLSNGTSKKAFSSNVGSEVRAGKPVKQAVAIAYAQDRKNKRVRKKWNGGLIDEDENGLEQAKDDSNEQNNSNLFANTDRDDFYEPAETAPLKEEPHEDKNRSLADALKKRRRMMGR